MYLHEEPNLESMTPMRAFYVFKKGFLAKQFAPHFALCIESSCVGQRFRQMQTHLTLDVSRRLVVDELAIVESFLDSAQLLEKVRALPLNLIIEAENLGKKKREDRKLKLSVSLRITRGMHSVLHELAEESYEYELSGLVFKEDNHYCTAVQFKGQWFFCRGERVSVFRAQLNTEKPYRYFYLRKNHECVALYRIVS